MRDKATFLFWLHVANRNDSMLEDYLNTLDDDVFSPYLQFTDDEVDILKKINNQFSQFLNDRRRQTKVRKFNC